MDPIKIICDFKFDSDAIKIIRMLEIKLQWMLLIKNECAGVT